MNLNCSLTGNSCLSVNREQVTRLIRKSGRCAAVVSNMIICMSIYFLWDLQHLLLIYQNSWSVVGGILIPSCVYMTFEEDFSKVAWELNFWGLGENFFLVVPELRDISEWVRTIANFCMDLLMDGYLINSLEQCIKIYVYWIARFSNECKL